MSFHEKLQWAPQGKGKASFRGIPFFIEKSETSVGRRVEVKFSSVNTENVEDIIDKLIAKKKKAAKKIGKDDVWVEDLGPDADSFIINGYVVQNINNNYDHFPERDALISALKTKGPGELIHPSFGKVLVSLVEKAKLSESYTEELGIARFEMHFGQYKKPIFKEQEPDYVNKIDTSALSTVNAALDGFTEKVRTVGAFINTLTAPINNTLTKIQNAVSSVRGAVASTINMAVGIVTSVLSTIDTLLDAPCDLANQLMEAGAAAKSLVGMAGEIITGGIIGLCSGEVRGNVITMSGDTVDETLGKSICDNLSSSAQYDTDDLTSVPDEQANNVELVATVAQVGMLTTAAQIAIRIEFSNQEDMEDTLQNITDAMDYTLTRLGSVDDEIDDPLLFKNLSQLRNDLVFSMYKKNTDLAKQITYTVPGGVKSALLLAYEQYGDIERQDEIFQRNKTIIKHPGFLPGGEDIRILSE